MWFTMYEDLFDDSGSWSTGCIGEITMSGAVTLTELTRGGTVQSGADPEGIVLGPDGDVWVADPGTSAIDRITPSGAVTEYMISSTVGVPAELAVGPDSAIWFTEVDNYWVRSSTSGAEPSSYVGSISTDGHTLQQYSLGSYSAASLSPGPVDGALWFTDPNNDSVGGVTLGDYVGEYPLPTANALPEYLTGASNGSIWASESKVPGVATFSPPSDLGFAVQAPVQTFPVGANLSSVVFVHGINGNFRALQNAASSGDASNWGELLEPLAGNSNLSVFPYYQDLGYSAIGTANADCGVMPAPVTYPTSNLYLNPVGSVLGEESSSFCDSESALALDAQALDQFVQSKQANVVVANSMGGAIARGWLAYAQHKDPTDTSPEMKDLEDVVFLQGAQQGSWLAGLGEGAQGGVTAALGPVLGSLEKLAVERLSFDPLRPGVADLAPTSDWYKSVNSDPIPTNVNYYNVFTDEQIQLETCFLMWCGNTGSPVQMGDTVMLPGGDAPSAMPSTGGARFLPAAQAGYQRYEYEIGDLYTWSLAGVIKNPIGSASILIDNPASHFNFGSHANEASAFTVRSCNSSQQVTVTNLVLQVVRGEC
jgi:streptogramin lyase